MKVKKILHFFKNLFLCLKVTRLWVNFSYHDEHKFRDTVSLMRSCGAGVETTSHYKNFAFIWSMIITK